MADWHINATLGPAVDELGKMTEGLGKPLRQVQESSVISYGANPTADAGDGTVAGDMNATNWTGHPFAAGTCLSIETAHVVTVGHKDVSYLYQGPRGVCVGVGGDYVTTATDYSVLGTADHSLLQQRDAANAHPMTAVTGLTTDQQRQDDAHTAHTGASADAHPMAAITGLTTDQARQDTNLTNHTGAAADAHPMAAITGLVGDQSRQDTNLNNHMGAAADAHPMAAITGLVVDQSRQDTNLSDHIAHADPHPQYYNQARGDARYRQLAPGIVVGGDASSFSLGTTQTKLTNYEFGYAWNAPGGVFDTAAGQIDVPEDGVYRFTASVIGTQGNTTKEEVIILNLDITNGPLPEQGREPIGEREVPTDKTDVRSITAVATRPFYAGQVLSLWMEASAGLGTFTVLRTTFEIVKETNIT